MEQRMYERFGVNVHYNSGEPQKYGALAFTRGSDVHIATGQERHLEHELGHVVQQRRGSVPVTAQVNGASLNDSPALESEADRLGASVCSGKLSFEPETAGAGSEVIQRYTVNDDGNEKTSNDGTLKFDTNNPNKFKICKRNDGVETGISAAGFNAQLQNSQITLAVIGPEENPEGDDIWETVTAEYNGNLGGDMTAISDCGRFAGLVFDYNNCQIAAKNPNGSISRIDADVSQGITMSDKARHGYFNHLEATKPRFLSSMGINDQNMCRDDAIQYAINRNRGVHEELGINEYANPEVGGGYLTKTLNCEKERDRSKKTWNHHWSAVVAKSADRDDDVIIENYASYSYIAGKKVWETNKNWNFDMHGRGIGVYRGMGFDPSFHNAHKSGGQHGTSPMTLPVAPAQMPQQVAPALPPLGVPIQPPQVAPAQRQQSRIVQPRIVAPRVRRGNSIRFGTYGIN
ncbi:hypothetical protein FACS1894120_3160 [Clostridia bacterium]|nr:hypothetical protein FACS1894120_3160 [Clostridia bacterium]